MLGMMGAGKGTQAKKLAAHLNIPHISTGDIFRQAAQEGTELGLRAKKIMEEGGLVDDETVLGIVKERVQKSDASGGFILDGFPRTVQQAREFEKIENIDIVFYLDIPREEAVKRLRGRRECGNCSKQYNIYLDRGLNEKCPECGTDLSRRLDDNEETVKKRIENYMKMTIPLTDYYRELGILKKINATGEIKDIFEKIKFAL